MRFISVLFIKKVLQQANVILLIIVVSLTCAAYLY